MNQTVRQPIRLALPAAALALLAFGPSGVLAQGVQCQITTYPRPLAFRDIAIARDAAVGAPISEELMVRSLIRCPRNASFVRGSVGFEVQMIPTQGGSRTVSNAWETGIPGIGVRVFSVSLGRTISGPSPANAIPTINNRNPTTANYFFRHQLVKTGPISLTGNITGRTIYTMRNRIASSGRITDTLDTVNLGTLSVTSRTCTVTTPSVNVPMSRALASTLSRIGEVTGTTNFTIGLQCESGFAVHITLTDATTPGNRTDILTLAPASTAEGVGIRIRKADNMPVSFGPDSAVPENTNQWLVDVSDGLSSIPMTAEYVATGAVTPGTVHGLATFTMSYQ
ncbi:fimbrial protein [Cupriavidus agavae]|uniref:Type 1 fimbria pilin n=1 Tax=Cupriavidus agavae TaxID=1001822 RepID=A0A4V2FI91_9BURK|nr:fimbrial protein [Cupriavidus agavae]RZT42959.1 type 1 fimbria pilin [Cupriavidus agavae]